MALGELVGEGRGRITTMRLLPDGKMEVSQQGTGKLLGSEISDAIDIRSGQHGDTAAQ